MNRSGILVLLLLVSVSACAKDPPPPPAESAAQRAATTPPPSSAPSKSSAKTEIETATQESVVDAAEPRERGDAGLERLAALPADQQLPNGRWKVGTHYTPLVPAQPTNVGAGEVEVVEVLWYSCNHCYALEPYLESWDKSNAEYIKLVRMPVVWSPGHRPEARLFYTFEALGRRDLHQKVFESIHQRGKRMLGTSEAATQKLHVDFAKANGIDEKQFLQAYNSFSVSSNLTRAERLTESYRVPGTPYFVVNGKYTTDVSMAGGQTQLLALLADLAASEKR